MWNFVGLLKKSLRFRPEVKYMCKHVFCFFNVWREAMKLLLFLKHMGSQNGADFMIKYGKLHIRCRSATDWKQYIAYDWLYIGNHWNNVVNVLCSWTRNLLHHGLGEWRNCISWMITSRARTTLNNCSTSGATFPNREVASSSCLQSSKCQDAEQLVERITAVSSPLIHSWLNWLQVRVVNKNEPSRSGRRSIRFKSVFTYLVFCSLVPSINLVDPILSSLIRVPSIFPCWTNLARTSPNQTNHRARTKRKLQLEALPHPDRPVCLCGGGFSSKQIYENVI